jgi:ATP-binding cassette, subfamily B, bacterial PglK
MRQMCVRLWRAIKPERRKQFFGLLMLMVLGSITEVISIGAVLPFLGALANPERIFANPALQPLFRLLNMTSPQDIIVPLTLAFCAASLAAGGMRVAVLRLSVGYAFGLGADISNEVYRRSLHQPYSVHVARNSSEVINGIAIKTSEVIFYVIVPAMTLFSGMFMSIAIIATLAWIVPMAALGSFIVFGVLYTLMMRIVRRRLKDNSEKIALESTNTIRYLQEGLGGIRDILIDGRQEVFVSTFARADWILRNAQRDNQVTSLTPRFIMDAVGMVLIAMLALILSRGSGGMAVVIPTLAALALGLQRLLPALQQLYQSWSTIHSAEGSLRETLKLLEQPMPPAARADVPRLRFDREIRLDQLGFEYSPNAPRILDGLDLVIAKGSRVGFMGQTGSGKSTLLDIIMGLLHPTQGRMLVDGVEVTRENVDGWRPHIAHVPQDIYLTDGSVRENIAFGVPPAEIDDEAVRRAAHSAQIGDVIESWSQGYKTKVGERGVQLSGGQRQRIGIARALYKKADLLIFDEATSALDSGTETAVMASIEALDAHITILMIAHRTSTLKTCDQIIELGRVPATAAA